MSDANTKAFLPLGASPPSDDEPVKFPIPVKDKVAMHATRIVQKVGGSSISPVPTRNNIKTKHGGQLLAPAPGRLTPLGQGRVKAPPICTDASLKKVASGMGEFNTAGVCFSNEEADRCAEKALALNNAETGGDNIEQMPLNINKSDAVVAGKCQGELAVAGSSEGKPFVSSSSTVITTSSAGSCGRSIMGKEAAVAASSTAKKDPPLKVVRTDLAVNQSEDEHPGVTNANPTTSALAKCAQLIAPPQRASSSSSLSPTFNDNLVKEKSSRQGRSRQRWLLHSPTEELVRQVAGTIPITRDGRIVLASASRKNEWILPKGGWDADETREECAARETFEEAGLLGRLGGCLEPIDYETKKARKRRLLGDLQESGAGSESVGLDKRKREGEVEKGKREDEGLPHLQSKRAKADKSASCATISEVNKTTARPQPAPAMASLVDPKSHKYVRLFLFPLYVTSAKSDWPEKGRLRKLVEIDEAIQIMESENRLYFKRALETVKERGLHLLKPYP